jgi:hypothetical protein
VDNFPFEEGKYKQSHLPVDREDELAALGAQEYSIRQVLSYTCRLDLKNIQGQIKDIQRQTYA